MPELMEDLQREITAYMVGGKWCATMMVVSRCPKCGYKHHFRVDGTFNTPVDAVVAAESKLHDVITRCEGAF